MFRVHSILLVTATLALALPVAALEDPTRPPGYGVTHPQANKATKPRWRLLSTLIAPGRRVANINGELVHQGERIGGARLVEIQPAAVVLQHNGRRITLSLLPKDFKRIEGAR